jgi:hypothetical protein
LCRREPSRFRSQAWHLSQGTSGIAILDSIDHQEQVATAS